MKKETINWLVDLYIKIRKKSLNSLLALSITLLAREIASRFDFTVKIVAIIKESTFFTAHSTLSKIVEITGRIIFIEGNNISLEIFLAVFVVLAILKGMEILSTDSPKFREREKEIEQREEARSDKKIRDYMALREKKEKERNVQINLLNNLINKGLIEEEEIYNRIRSGDLYAVYISPIPLPVKDYPKNRLYPEFLEELRFVRMGRFSTLFITNRKRLPKNLRNTKELQEFLLKKLDKTLSREWVEVLTWLKIQRKKELKEQYKLYKNKTYNEVLGLSITIIRGKVNEDNLGFLHGNILPSKFKDMLNEEIDLDKIHIPSNKKIAINKFVLGSSFELLFYGEKKTNLEKLKSIENELKNSLEIEKFTDYQYKSKEDITNVFKNKFTIQEAEKYADILIKRSKKYEIALRSLGISV
jgi:hypothetical protein